MVLHCYIIHLDRAAARRPQVERLRADLAWPVDVISAIDATQLSNDELAMYRPQLHRPHYPFALNKGEIAAFLSHRKAWQKIVDDGVDVGLVLEDDVACQPIFNDTVRACLSDIKAGDFVRFAKNMREKQREMLIVQANFSMFVPRHVGLGMLAQIVTRDAALCLLERTAFFDRPVDTYLQMRWISGVTMKTVQPVLVADISAELGGTTVQTKNKPKSNRLRRTLQRAWFRFALWWMSTIRQG